MRIYQLLIVIFFLFGSLPMSAQQYITDLSITPEGLLTPDDEISTVADTYHAYSPCTLDGSTIYLSNDTIYVDVMHTMGFLTATCSSTDTISLGNFAPGTYQITYLFYSYLDENFSVTDTAYTTFTVQGVNSMHSGDDPELLSVYPNPTQDFLTVKSTWRGRADVFNLLGERVKSFQINESPMRLDVRKLTPGMYFMNVMDDSKPRSIKFLVR